MKRCLAVIMAGITAIAATGCSKNDSSDNEYINSAGDVINDAASVEAESTNLVVSWMMDNDVSAYSSVQKYKELNEAGSELAISDTHIMYDEDNVNVHVHIPELSSGIGVLRGENLRYNEDGTISSSPITELVLSDQDYAFGAISYDWYDEANRSSAFFGYVEEIDLAEAISYVDLAAAIDGKTAYEAVDSSSNSYVDNFMWFSIRGDSTSRHLYAVVGYDGSDAEEYNQFSTPTLLSTFVKDVPADGFLSMPCRNKFRTQFSTVYLVDIGPVSLDTANAISDIKVDNSGEDTLYAFMHFNLYKDASDNKSLVEGEWTNNTGEYLMVLMSNFDARTYEYTFFPLCNSEPFSRPSHTLDQSQEDLVVNGLDTSALADNGWVVLAPGESIYIKYTTFYYDERGDIQAYPAFESYAVIDENKYDQMIQKIQKSLKDSSRYIIDSGKIPANYKS